MSLIDEALKRAQAGHQDAMPGAARPWAPTPLPDRRRLRRRQTKSVLGACLLAVLLGGALSLVIRRNSLRRDDTIATPLSPRKRPASRSAGEGRGGVSGKVLEGSRLTGASTASTQGGPPGRQAPGGSVPGQAGEPRPDRPQRHADAARSEPSAAAAPEDPAATVTPRSGAEGQAREVGASGKTYVGEAPLPGGGKIELGGIVYSETNPVALLNGRVLGQGAVVEGLTITRIQENRVELRGNGVTISILLK